MWGRGLRINGFLVFCLDDEYDNYNIQIEIII